MLGSSRTMAAIISKAQGRKYGLASSARATACSGGRV
jgi:hypothetical protein